MMKILKWAFLIILILVFLVIAGVGIAVATLDPNDYKEQITAQVKKATGRELTLAGDISWSVFPWLGLNLGKTSLANAKGFGDQPFAELDEIDIHVALMPLIKKQIQAQKILISGVNVNLQKNADGTDNWSDLAGEGEQKEDTPKRETSDDTATPDIDIQINGFEIVNARLSYNDKQAGTNVRIDPLNLKTGKIALDSPVPLEADLTLFQDKMSIDAHLSGTLHASLENGEYQFADLIIQQTVKGKGIPGGSLSGTEKANIQANTNTQKLTIDSLSLDTLGMLITGHVSAEQFIDGPQFTINLKSNKFNPLDIAEQLDIKLEDAHKDALAGMSFHLKANGDTQTQLMAIKSFALESPDLQLSSQMNVKQFIDKPQFTGEIKTNTFNPKALMTQLGIEAPATTDDKALTRASIEIGISGNLNSIHLKPFKATMDDSTLSGTVSIIDVAKQALRFNLTLDELNADHYLPPTSATTEPTKTTPGVPTTQTSDVIALPTEMMRSLNVDGIARINQFTVNKLSFQDASLTVKANKGLLALAPLSAKAYRGTAKIDASLDVRKNTPRYKTQVNLSGVRSGEILEVLFGDRLVSGAANFKTNISTTGNSISALEKNLNGNFATKFTDGTIKGSKLSQKINEFRNFLRKLKGKPPLTDKVDKDTKFSLLAATGNIKNGIVTNNDLRLEAPVFLATGEGTVDLPKKTINYTLSLADEGKTDKKYFVPLQVKGPFNDLGFKLKLDSVAKLHAKEALDAEKAKLQKKVDAEKAKLKEKAKQEENKLKQKLEDKLKGQLKGLFK
jgi:AsmA protein